MAEHAAQQIPVPDEGSLDADLRALARAVVASVATRPSGPPWPA